MRFTLKLLATALCLAAVVPVSTVSAHHSAQPSIKIPLGWPQRLMIPRFKVDAPVESLALNRPADAHAPYNWSDVAWFNRGARPGDVGRAAVFGHLDSTCCPAIFYHLRDMKAGDTIQVKYKTGTALAFRVLWSTSYPNNKLPVKFIFGPAHERGLTLITCTGIFHRDGSGYDRKFVVYARLLLPNGKLG